MVDLILQRHPSAIDVKDDAGKTAMDYAKNPACLQQSKVGQVEVVAVLNRAEGYQTIAKMIQEQAGKDVCQQREQLQQAEKKMGLLRRELELELGRQEDADGSMTTLLGQLKHELHASRKDAVMKDVVASTAVGTANNLERQLAQVKEELIDAGCWVFRSRGGRTRCGHSWRSALGARRLVHRCRPPFGGGA